MLNCIVKSGEEYEALKAEFGEVLTSYVTRLNNNVFPTIEEAREILDEYSIDTEKNYYSPISETNSFSDPKLNALGDMLSSVIGDFKVTNRPAAGLFHNGAINERHLLQNEVTIDELLPLFLNKFKNSPTIYNKIKSYLGEDLDSITEEMLLSRLDYTMDTNAEANSYITNLIKTQLENKGYSSTGNLDFLLSSWIGEHNDMVYSMSPEGELSIMRHVYGSLTRDEMAPAQLAFDDAYHDTEQYFHPPGTDPDKTHRKMSKNDFEPWEWREMEHIAKGKGYVERYVLAKPIRGRYYVLHRVSDGKSNHLNRRKTEEELKALEEGSQIYTMTGTLLHEVKENAVKKLFPEFTESMYTELQAAIIKNKMIQNSTIDQLYSTLWNQIKHSDKYTSLRDAWLANPDCPFTDEITYYIDGKEIIKKVPGNASNNYDKMLASLLKNYIEFIGIQVGIDWETNQNLKPDEYKWNKANFYAERRVLDIKYDTVGTLDLMVVYSDGTASIFDYKFMKAKTKFIEIEEGRPKKEILDVDAVEESYMKSKMEVYDDQISKYSDILGRVYGIKRVRTARIDPSYIKYTTNASGDVTINSKVFSIYTNEEAFGTIPTQAERTGNKGVDKFLDSIEEQIYIMTNRLSTTRTWSRDHVTVSKLSQLRKIMRAIQVNGDFEGFFDYIKSFNTRGENLLSNTHMDKLSLAELNNMKDEALFITSFIEDSNAILAPFKEQYPKLIESFKNSVSVEMARLRSITDLIKDASLIKIEQYAVHKGMRPEVFKGYEYAPDVNSIKANMMGLQQIDHSFAQVLARSISETAVSRIQFMKEIAEENEIKLDSLKEWGKNKGLKGIDIFKPIISKRGHLITPYNEEYYRQKQEHSNTALSENVEWFKNNFHRSKTSLNGLPSDEDRFQEALAHRKDTIELIVASKATEEERKEAYDELLDKWLKENDIEHSEFKAWHENPYISPKNPDAWYSEQYKFMMASENKPLRDYYEFLLRMNKEFTKMLGSSVQIASNFIPNIKKETMDSVLQDGLSLSDRTIESVRGAWHTMKKIVNNKETVLKKTSHGKNEYEIPDIPVTFINNLNDDSEKSFDLGKNVMIFAAFVNHYHHMLEVKEVGRSLMYLAQQQKYVVTDAKGDKIEDTNDITGFKRESKPESNLYKVLKSNIDYYVYGNEDGNDVITQTLGTTSNKVIGKIIKETSRQAMTLNLLSASAGFFNSQLQITYIASAGKFFDHKNHGKALSMAVKGDPKLIWASLFFGNNSNQVATNFMADGASVYDINKFNRHSIGMAFQHWFDKMDDRVLMGAMLQTYGIDPETEQVARLEKLKEKYKNHPKYKDTEWKSLLDSIEEVNIDSKNGTYKLVNQHTGKEIKVSRLSGNDEDNDKNLTLITSFRRKVTYLANVTRGAINEDDRARYSGMILGKALGQFRRWMPGTFHARLKGEGYNDALDEFEVGRWIATAKLAIKMKHNLIGTILKSITPGNSIYGSLNDDAMKEMYDLYIKENPTLKDVVSFEDYKREYAGQLKSLLWEVMIFTMIAFLLTSLVSFAGGDDEDNYAMSAISTLIDRTILEIGIFVPLVGIQELGKMVSRDPFPMVRTFYTWGNFLYETYDEPRDSMFGENSTQDRSSWAKWAVKLMGGSSLANITGASTWINDGRDDKEGTILSQDNTKVIYK